MSLTDLCLRARELHHAVTGVRGYDVVLRCGKAYPTDKVWNVTVGNFNAKGDTELEAVTYLLEMLSIKVRDEIKSKLESSEGLTKLVGGANT